MSLTRKTMNNGDFRFLQSKHLIYLCRIKEKDDTTIVDFTIFLILVKHGPTDPTQFKPDLSRFANKSPVEIQDRSQVWVRPPRPPWTQTRPWAGTGPAPAISQEP